MYKLFREKVMTIRNLSVLCVVSLMMATALPATASSPVEEEGRKRQASEVRSSETVTTKTIRVIYDPESGEIISDPGQETGVLSAPLANALTRSTEGLQVFELSNGGKGVYLAGRFQHALMVQVRPDGSLETLCTSHSHAAEEFLKAGSAETNELRRDK